MSINNKLVAIFACCALFAAPAEARTLKASAKTHHGHFVKKSAYCPLHVTAGGSLADCRGWRLRRNATGWDNTCFRSLDYLPSMYACGSTNF
jgi:hypothetical protein